MDIRKIKPAFQDERGSIWDFLTNESTDHIGFIITKKGAVRGKHYHKEQKQHTLVLRGRIRVTIKNLVDSNSTIEVFELCPMDTVLFPPFYYHSIEALEDSECLVFTSKSREGSKYEEDTFRVGDINSFKI